MQDFYLDLRVKIAKDAVFASLDRLDALLEPYDLTQTLVLNVRLAMEELLLNLCEHTHLDGDDEAIAIFDSSKGSLSLILSDSGSHFNPLTLPAVDTEIPLENCPIGGRGIHLIKHTTSSLEYRRTEGRNEVRIRWDNTGE